MGEKRTFRVELCFDLEVDTDWYPAGATDEDIISVESNNILMAPEECIDRIGSIKMSRTS